MAAESRKYLVLEAGVQKVKESQTDEVIFTTVKIGGAGGKLLSIVSGKWDFNAAKLSNIVAGAATGEAVEYDQMNTALAGKANTSHTHTASEVTDFTTAARTAAVADSITDAVTNIAPSQNAVFDALAGKSATGHTHTASEVTDFTAAAKTAVVSDTAYGAGWNGVTDVAPSKNAVYDIVETKISSSEKGANSGVATLDAGGKIPAAQLPNSVMEYQGTYNASTNTPSLSNGTGNAGDVYVVSVAGSRDFGAGSITFAAGDWVLYSGSVYEKSVNSNAVASVNGQTGVVVLDTDDVSEGSTNLYHTAARAKAAAVADSITDGITDVAPSQNAVFDALAGKSATGHTHTASNVTDFDSAALAASVQSGAITDGVTKAPTHDAVFDALALKADISVVGYTKNFTNDNLGSITVRQLVYVKANGAVDLANAATASLDEFAIGMVSAASIATTASGAVTVKPGSIVSGFSGLTPGKKLYLHNSTLGSYTQDASTIGTGNWLYAIGRALSATEVLFMPTLDPIQV